MFSLSEIIFLLILALLVIGPKQLPEVARYLGRFINEMKRATSSITDELEKKDNDGKPS
jgi:sec-independent protein translocase protein TatB